MRCLKESPFLLCICFGMLTLVIIIVYPSRNTDHFFFCMNMKSVQKKQYLNLVIKARKLVLIFLLLVFNDKLFILNACNYHFTSCISSSICSKILEVPARIQRNILRNNFCRKAARGEIIYINYQAKNLKFQCNGCPPLVLRSILLI